MDNLHGTSEMQVLRWFSTLITHRNGIIWQLLLLQKELRVQGKFLIALPSSKHTAFNNRDCPLVTGEASMKYYKSKPYWQQHTVSTYNMQGTVLRALHVWNQQPYEVGLTAVPILQGSTEKLLAHTTIKRKKQDSNPSLSRYATNQAHSGCKRKIKNWFPVTSLVVQW